MSQKFSAVVHHRDDVSFIKLAGVIDEDNELTEVIDKLLAPTIAIDLAEVQRINSAGVRDWVNWLARLGERASGIVLIECSPAMVAQINLVHNFTGNAYVKSFYVPYFCPECDEEKSLLVEAADLGPPPHEPPTCRCDECDLVMEFDDLADSYFAFLSTEKQLRATEEMQSVLDEMGPDGERSRIRSRIGTASMPASQVGHASSLPSIPSLPSISMPGRRMPLGGTSERSIAGGSRASSGGFDHEDAPTTPLPPPTPTSGQPRAAAPAVDAPGPRPPRPRESIASGPSPFASSRVTAEPPRGGPVLYIFLFVVCLAIGGAIYTLIR